MEKQQSKSKNILKIRSYKLALDIIALLERLTKNYIYEILGKQLLRVGTSIGANIIEAQAGRTKKDFANFYQIALKSANETKFWLAILREKIENEKEQKLIQKLLQETIEISNILGASLITIKGKRKF